MLSFYRYMGTITAISDLDPVRWKNSQWLNLQVGFLVCFGSMSKHPYFIFTFANQIFFLLGDLKSLCFFNRLAGMSLQLAKGGTGFQSGRLNQFLLRFSYALHHFSVQNVPGS
jgi:hypothetical protein